MLKFGRSSYFSRDPKMRYIHSGQASAMLEAHFAGNALDSLGKAQAIFIIHIKCTYQI